MSTSENDATEEDVVDMQSNENDNLTESYISGDRSDSGIENLSSVEDSFSEGVPLQNNEDNFLREASCNEANSVSLQYNEGENISSVAGSSYDQDNSVPIQGKGDDEIPYLDPNKDEEFAQDKCKADLGNSIEDLPLTKDEALRLQELLEDSDIPSLAEDFSDKVILPTKGFCLREVEAVALNDIENRLKALLTKDEYSEIHQQRKKYEFSDTRADHSEEYISTKMKNQLQDIDQKLKDLYEKPFELIINEDTVKKLVNESSKQLLKLKTEGVELPELTEDDIQVLIAEAGIEIIE